MIDISIKMTVVGKDEWKEILHVASDGASNFHVVGDLRHTGSSPAGEQREYHTSDDLNVIGQIVRHLSAQFAREVLRRELAAHEAREES